MLLNAKNLHKINSMEVFLHLVRPPGLEPGTKRLWVFYSNQLSYRRSNNCLFAVAILQVFTHFWKLIMENIKNIIFDYGNVIFTIDFQRTQQAFINLGISNIEDFFAHKGHDPLFDEFEKGNISADAFRNGIRRKANKPQLSDQQIDTAWNTIFVGIDEGNHELLLKIKQKYNTFLLSNTNEIHFKYFSNYVEKTFGLKDNSSLFNQVYYSHLLGMRKPNADIFEYVLQANHLKPSETLFIDDSPQHLKTAQQLGMHTYLMTAPDNVQTYFKTNGLL